MRTNGAQADGAGTTVTSKRVPFTSTSVSPVATTNRPPRGTLATSASSVPLSSSNRWAAPSAARRTRDDAPTRRCVPVSSASRRSPLPGTRTDAPSAMRSPRAAAWTPSGVSIEAAAPSTAATASCVAAADSPRATLPVAALTAGRRLRHPTNSSAAGGRARPTRAPGPGGAAPGRAAHARSRPGCAISIRRHGRRPRFIAGGAAREHLGREARITRVVLGSPHPVPSVLSSSIANSGSAAMRAPAPCARGPDGSARRRR